MFTISTIFVFVFGTLVGSFINVISLRYNTGLSISFGRSKCFSCGEKIKWHDLVPIFSFAFLLGKCRTCKNPISFQYPIVEFLTGFLFTGIFIRQINLWPLYQGFDNGFFYSSLFFLYYIVVFSILLVIAIYDIRHKVIPDFFVYTFIFLGALKLLLFVYCKYRVVGSITGLDTLDLFAPLILFLPFAFLWVISKGTWIGFGDAKLMLGVGFLLGFVQGVSVTVLSFWLGSLWIIGLLIHNKLNPNYENKIGLRTEIPFAPFIILAIIIVFLGNVDVLNLGALLDNIY